jgi:hypothetical protein
LVNLHVDREFLQHFETGLDLRRPERSAIPARVLAQGRVSTVFTLGEGPQPLAFKRLAVFRSDDDAIRYEALHRKYVRSLGERAGVRVLPSATLRVRDASGTRIVVYIIQEQAHEDCIGHQAIYLSGHLHPVDAQPRAGAVRHDAVHPRDAGIAADVSPALGAE